MTQENRELLLIDLLGRLPYGVKVLISLDIRRELGLDIIHNFIYNNICGVRPYLRPMSDMTEEERRELGKIPAITEYIDETQPDVPNYIEVARPLLRLLKIPAHMNKDRKIRLIYEIVYKPKTG